MPACPTVLPLARPQDKKAAATRTTATAGAASSAPTKATVGAASGAPTNPTATARAKIFAINRHTMPSKFLPNSLKTKKTSAYKVSHFFEGTPRARREIPRPPWRTRNDNENAQGTPAALKAAALHLDLGKCARALRNQRLRRANGDAGGLNRKARRRRD